MLTPKLASLCCVVLGLAIFAYSVARVSLTSFNNDESITYLYFVRSSVTDIINYNSRFLPTNNHLLNSLLMKFSSSLLGPSEVALRLPNLLAHILYITSSFLIVRRYVPTNLMPLGFLLLNLNPYMLEFFSLARGYGLALGFMMCSIYFCLRYLESRERGPLNVFLASLFAGLSLLSSFPFVNYYFGMCAVVTVVTLSRLRSCPSGRLAFVFRNGFPLVFTSLVFIMISAPPMLKLRQVMPSLRQVEGFVVGGKVGFWEDTVLSLIRSSLYRQTYTDALVTPLAIVLMVMVVVGGGLFLYGMWRQWFDQRLALTFVAVPITLTIAASSILQHHLLGVEYLKDRIAVMFVPLVSLVVLASTAYVASAGQRPVVRNAGVLVLTLFTLGASLHTLKSFNVTHSLVLRGNASTRQVVDDLTAEHQASREQGLRGRLTLGSSPVYRPTIDYYTVSRKLTWLKSVNLLSPEADYVYYRPEDEPTVSEMSVTPLTVYPISDAVLAKKG